MGRNYWDWDNPIICGIVSMCGDYIMKNPQAFPDWQMDLRNILTLIFNRNGADPGSMGDVYHGAGRFRNPQPAAGHRYHTINIRRLRRCCDTACWRRMTEFWRLADG